MHDNHSHELPTMELATSELERAIEATRVVGELGQWIGAVSRALNTAYEVLTHEVIPQHQNDFAQIRANDLALEPRVEQMMAADNELREQLDAALRLAAEIEHTLVRSNGQVETGTKAEQLFEQCVVLIIRLRKQEQAVNSWFVEALQRDRGVVD